MDPVLIIALAKFGIDTVCQIVDAWKKSGEPSADEIKALFIDKQPEEYFQ